MHYGQICNQGSVCTVSNGDRTMADYFALLARPRPGAIQIVFNDTTSQHHGAHLYEIAAVGRADAAREDAHASRSRPIR